MKIHTYTLYIYIAPLTEFKTLFKTRRDPETQVWYCVGSPLYVNVKSWVWKQNQLRNNSL